VFTVKSVQEAISIAVAPLSSNIELLVVTHLLHTQLSSYQATNQASYQSSNQSSNQSIKHDSI
jgi:hypothetical protein